MDLGRLGLSPFLSLLCSVRVRCQVRADGTGSVDVRPWSVTLALPHTSDHRVLPARPWPSGRRCPWPAADSLWPDTVTQAAIMCLFLRIAKVREDFSTERIMQVSTEMFF